MFYGTCVYVHRKATSGEVFYVGMGTRARSKSKTTRNPDWERVEREHGRVVQIVDVFEDPKHASAAEVEIIDLLTSMGAQLVNRTKGGEGGKAYAIRTVEQAIDKTRDVMGAMGEARRASAYALSQLSVRDRAIYLRSVR